jgi:hypothetical protein
MQTPTACGSSPTSQASTRGPHEIFVDCDHDYYDLIAGWWRETHAITFLPAECLPPTLLVARRGNNPIAAVALYFMEAMIAQIAFAVVDPQASRREALTALDDAIGAAVQMARGRMGRHGFIACVTHDAVLHRMVQRHHGFTALPAPFASHLLLDPGIDPGNISS